ncbi:MAG: threonylcarbamoyl-AMP synthase [Chloroflexia bacterium]|nr:threonylcarbamoyl-AMP synthase [Chloroflexia bacterium]
MPPVQQDAWSTVILPLSASNALDEAVFWLSGGQVLALPTDTVYGLGASLNELGAVERLYQVKGRPWQRGLPLLLSELAEVDRFCQDVPEAAWRLARRFWPGGLTLVLWRRSVVPDLVTAGRPSVAVRLPDHALPRTLARRLGVPLVVTSANLSGQPSPVTAAGVWGQLAGRIPLIVDGGACPGGQASTILDLTAEPPRLLRDGGLSRGELEQVSGLSLVGVDIECY